MSDSASPSLHHWFRAIFRSLPLRLPLALEIALGACVAALPFLISLWMAPIHRSPYLLSYPAVVLSAWVLGLRAAISCAIVSGCAIEYFIFATHRINLAPDSHGWFFRESIFIFGSILVGTLTRAASQQRQDAHTASLQRELHLSQAEKQLALEKARATELALENQVRVEMALDGANAGLWEWDLLANTEVWTSGFYRLHGLDPALPARNDIWRASVAPADVDNAEREIDLAVQRKDTFYTEYRVPLANGGIRWIACQGVCHLDQEGNVVKITGYCGDVTRRKLTDQALLRSEKLAVAGRLSAAIAHEINNPVGDAMNLLYLLEDTSLNAQQLSYVEEISQQLHRVVEITRQTLQMSRSNQKLVAVRPADLVRETLRLLTPKLHLARVTSDMEARGNLEVLGSPGELQQVLTNLIHNSVEAMPEGGHLRLRIAPSLHWKDRTQRGVRITLSDTGVGMSPEVYRRMMEPFFTTKEDSGTGLGMWVVSELLLKHQGTLTIRSSVDAHWHGTCSSIFLPYVTQG